MEVISNYLICSKREVLQATNTGIRVSVQSEAEGFALPALLGSSGGEGTTSCVSWCLSRPLGLRAFVQYESGCQKYPKALTSQHEGLYISAQTGWDENVWSPELLCDAVVCMCCDGRGALQERQTAVCVAAEKSPCVLLSVLFVRRRSCQLTARPL